MRFSPKFITRSRPEKIMGAFDNALLLGMAAFGDIDAAMSATTTVAVASERNTTLLAVPDGDGALVTVPDEGTFADVILAKWFVYDILRAPSAEPSFKITASYNRVLIFPDRVEHHKRVMFWKLAETIGVEDIAAVETDKRRITVRSTDGREISIKDTSREGAEKARGVIEGRREVYSTPSMAAEQG